MSRLQLIRGRLRNPREKTARIDTNHQTYQDFPLQICPEANILPLGMRRAGHADKFPQCHVKGPCSLATAGLRFVWWQSSASLSGGIVDSRSQVTRFFCLYMFIVYTLTLFKSYMIVVILKPCSLGWSQINGAVLQGTSPWWVRSSGAAFWQLGRGGF